MVLRRGAGNESIGKPSDSALTGGMGPTRLPPRSARRGTARLTHWQAAGVGSEKQPPSATALILGALDDKMAEVEE